MSNKQELVQPCWRKLAVLLSEEEVALLVKYLTHGTDVLKKKMSKLYFPDRKGNKMQDTVKCMSLSMSQ